MMPWPYVLFLVGMVTVGSNNAAAQDPPHTVRPVSIDVGDLVLGAKLYPGEGDDPRPAIVLLHGWTWPHKEPSRGLVSAAREFQRSGYTVLVPSMRGWPPTGGRDDCAGQQVRDVLRALAWLGQRNRVDDSQLFLAGYSQGGQVALLAASYTHRCGLWPRLRRLSILAAGDKRPSSTAYVITSWKNAVARAAGKNAV